MINVLTYNQIDHEKWSRLVCESATGTWFQSPEAYAFFASMPELFRPFVFGLINDKCQMSNDQSRLRAVCAGYITQERNPIKQYFTRRAIIIGGPALADDATNEEVESLMNAVRQQLQKQPILNPSLKGRTLNAPIYIETRNFNDYSRWKEAFEKAGFAYQPHLNFHVDCTDSNLLWERMSENRKRQVRRAQNTDHCIDRVQKESCLEGAKNTDIIEWYQILERLYKTKVKTPLWPLEFFLEAYRQGVGHFQLVKHEEKVIGGSMLVQDEKSAYEWFECGMNKAYKEQYPSVMATYAGMEYAAAHGISRYDMMGAGEPGVPYGVRDFKAEFGGEQVEHGRFLHICKPWLYRLGVFVVRIMKK